MASRTERRKRTYVTLSDDMPTQSLQNVSSAHDDGEALRIHERLLRTSDLCSPEYQKFYEKQLAFFANRGPASTPARSASRSEWGAFDAQQDAGLRETLATVKSTYAIETIDTRIAGVRAGVITPRTGVASENRHRVLMHLHGGGFVHNRGLTFGQIEAGPVAAIGRIKIITLDYRQAPFHRYPAASEDVEAVYRQLLREHSPEAIGIFGCSAGGMLAAQAIAWLRHKGIARPGAVGVLSIAPPPPCVPSPRGWGESALWFSGIPAGEFSECERERWEPTGWYMDSADSSDPVAYPGLSDSLLASFPPTLFMSGTRDFAMSVTIAAHARFLKLGVDASLYMMEGGVHGGHAVAAGTPEAHDAQTYIARWFDRYLAR